MSAVVVAVAAIGTWCGGSDGGDAAPTDGGIEAGGPDRPISHFDGGDPEDATGCASHAADDVHNCGVCGRDCTVCGGTTCVDGGCVPTIIASAQPQPLAIVADATGVFWVNFSGNSSVPGSIASANLDGSGYKVLADAGSPYALAVDDANVIYGDSALMLFDRFSSAVTTLPGTIGAVQDIAVSGQTIFWANGAGGGRVESIHKDGGSNYVLGIPSMAPRAVAVDDASLYWGNVDGSVWKTPKTATDTTPGAAIYTPSSTGYPVNGLAVDATRLYWASFDGVHAANKDGSGHEIVSLDQPAELAIDADNLYWTHSVGADIFVQSKNRPPAHAISAGGNPTVKLAVGAQCIYWTSSNGKVCAVAK